MISKKKKSEISASTKRMLIFKMLFQLGNTDLDGLIKHIINNLGAELNGYSLKGKIKNLLKQKEK